MGGSQPLISYHLFVRNQEIFDYFIDLAWLISQRPIEYNYSVGLTPIELRLQILLYFVADLIVVLVRCFASNCLIIRDPVRGLCFGSRKRAGDRAKVSGKAGEGILMILALRAAKTGFTFGTIFYSTNNCFRNTQGAPDHYLSL